MPTLCNDNNMNVTECAPHVIGCVENVIESRSGDLKHEMRYCMDPKGGNSIDSGHFLWPVLVHISGHF